MLVVFVFLLVVGAALVVRSGFPLSFYDTSFFIPPFFFPLVCVGRGVFFRIFES